MKNSYILLLACCFIFSCSRNADDSGLALENEAENLDFSEDGALIFGWFYGECVGETCIEIYKMSKEALLEDVNDAYPNGTSSYSGDFRAYNFLDISLPVIAPAPPDHLFVLMEDFPEALFDETDLVIGQPDAGDWGGIYLEYQLGGIQQFWLIDQMKDNVPEYLHAYIDLVNTKVAQLSQD